MMRSSGQKYGFSLALDRAMHEAFVRLTNPNGVVPSRGVQEVREHRQMPWRVLARRFYELRQARVPREQAKEIVRTLDRWVDGLYGVGFAI